ncbi:transposase, MuDR, MULE transposase domain protein [Tanacetum coccineum]
MNDLLLDKTKDDIWKWFYCKHKCSLEEGLTLVENDRDMDKMFQLANLHGTLDLYIGQIPQVFLVDYYFKNLCCVDSDEEVTSMYTSHEKAKKDVSTMLLEELIAWEQEETQSLSYLRSPHVWKKTSASTSKGKVILDDFEDVANGKGKVVLDEFRQWVMEKVMWASYKSDDMVIEVFFGSCFFFCPLDYPGGKILDLRLPRSTRMSYKEMTDLLLDKTKDDIWKWFYCKPKCKLEKGLNLVENDRDCEKIFELANFHGYLDVYVGHNPQLKELIAWEQEETQSPSYLRSPHVWKKTSTSTSKGKVVLDDFEDVANGKGKVVLDDFADVGNGKEKHEWEYLLDIDDSDLQLSAPLRLSNSSNTSLLQTQEMYVDEKATRKIPGPAGIFQTDRIHKLNNFNDAPTQEYIRKLIDDVSEADNFKCRAWITALEFINHNREIRGRCFGDIKSYLKKGKLEKVVAIITSCKPNVLADINVTLKDPSGAMSSTIH